MARTDIEALRVLIRNETRFLRHYEAVVTDDQDELQRGRLQVEIPALGWVGAEARVWVWPRDRHSMIPAKVGEYVEVYFMGGKPERPVYIGQVQEQIENIPEAYEGPDQPILFQSPVTGDRIKYSEEEGAFDMEVSGDVLVTGGGDATVDVAGLVKLLAEGLEFGAASEAMVLGNQLQTYLDGLKIWMDTHAHTISSGSSAGSTTPPIAPSPIIPATLLSQKMSGE